MSRTIIICHRGDKFQSRSQRLLKTLDIKTVFTATCDEEISQNSQSGSFWPCYLTNTVDDDEHGSQEVTVGGILPHNVLVPQLDWNNGPEQLAQLLEQQVKLPLKTINELKNISEGALTTSTRRKKELTMIIFRSFKPQMHHWQISHL